MPASNGSSCLGAGTGPSIKVRLCSVPNLMALHQETGALGSDMLLIEGLLAVEPGTMPHNAFWHAHPAS